MNELYRSAIVSGIAVGGAYALIAVGITQVFAVTRILNFAQAGFAMWAAYLYAMFTIEKEWPVGIAAAAAIGCIALMGMLAELLVFRLASRASQVNKVILTFGLLLFLSALATKIWTYEPKAATPLMPSGGFDVLQTAVTWQQLCNLVAVIVIVALVTLFLRTTALGLQTRAMAEDSTVAELMGTSRNAIGMLNWTIAALIGGVGGVLAASIAPFQANTFIQFFFVALIASLFGGLSSLVLTAVGAVALSVILSVSQVASSAIGVGSLVVFLAVAALVLIRRRWPSDLSKIAWSKPQLSPGHKAWMVNRVALALGWLWLIYAVTTSDFWGQTGALILVYTVASYSLIPLIGWTGQISLAQGAFMGIGAFVLYEAYNHHELPLPVAALVVILAGAAAGSVLGLVTHRLSFVQTAIVTLAFTAAGTQWFLFGDWWNTAGGRVSVLAPDYLGNGRKLFVAFGIVTIAVLLVLRNIRRSQWGISFLAVRTAPNMARHFGLSPATVRVAAFAISGATAGIAGAMYIFLVSIADVSAFGIGLSLSVLLYAVAGGTTSLVGPLIGALCFIGTPQLLNLAEYGSTNWPDIIGGIAIVQLMATRPDGLLSLLRRPNHVADTRYDRIKQSVLGRIPLLGAPLPDELPTVLPADEPRPVVDDAEPEPVA